MRVGLKKQRGVEGERSSARGGLGGRSLPPSANFNTSSPLRGVRGGKKRGLGGLKKVLKGLKKGLLKKR